MSYGVRQGSAVARQYSSEANYVNNSAVIEKISSAIHNVQSSTACCSSCDSHRLSNDNKDLIELYRILNLFFSSGLIRRTESYWPFVKEFTSKAQITLILQTWRPQTSNGKSLAWLYQCLNDGTLEWQLRCFLDNFQLVNKYYKKNACMLDKQMLETVAMYLRGLDDVEICLQPRQRKSEISVCPNACNGRVTKKTNDNGDSSTVKKDVPGSNNSVSMETVINRGGVNVTISKKRQNSTLALLEQSVADFSGCPDLLGISAADTNLLLADAELCDEALDYNYPISFADEQRRGNNASDSVFENRVLRKKRPPVTKFVPKIVEITPTEPGAMSSLENSMNNDFNLPPADSFNSNEVSCSTPLTQSDADAMFREIIKGRRLSPEGHATPPKHFSPAKSNLSDAAASTNTAAQNSVNITRYSPSTLIEVSANDSKSEFFSAIEEPPSILRHKDDVDKKNNNTLNSLPRSDNIQISPRAQYTATPPNTFVKNGNDLIERADRKDKDDDDNYLPRSAFERQILNRLENVVLANRTSDSFSEKSSEKSSICSSKKSKPFSTNCTRENGTVESAADPQSGLTESSEMLLESGEVLELTVHVMKEGEQFYKMFRVYCNLHFGSPLLRFMLLTNTTLYLLINENADDKMQKEKYNVEFRIPYSTIDYISVGLDAQLFSLFLRQRQCVVICTASDTYTRSILSNLELAVRRAISHYPDLRLPAVLTDATPQKICLNKWIMGEIGLEDNVIHRYSLVHWNPNISTKVGSPSGGSNRNGYLYMREYYPNGWIKKSTEWQQSYFILRGKKFYQFEDLQCKFGKRVFDLTNEVIGCRQAETAEHTYCIELVLQDDSVVVQLSCPTKHELQQWLHAFVASFSQAETAQVTCACLACCAVITDGFLLLGQETTTVGFVRTLAITRLEAMHSFKISKTLCSLSMVVPSSTIEDGENWLLCFTCESELTKFVNTLKSLLSDMQCEELQDDCQGAHFIRECYQHWSAVDK